MRTTAYEACINAPPTADTNCQRLEWLDSVPNTHDIQTVDQPTHNRKVIIPARRDDHTQTRDKTTGGHHMTKEQIYDSELAHLITRIVEIAEENKIAMFACFAIGDERSQNIICTTTVWDDISVPPGFMAACHHLNIPLTARDAEDETTATIP